MIMGIDTITAGNCVGFAFELYEKGIITKADTDGLELTYGDHGAMIELIKKIGSREGFGNILAEGVMGGQDNREKCRGLRNPLQGHGAAGLRTARGQVTGI